MTALCCFFTPIIVIVMSATQQDIEKNFLHIGGLKNKVNPKTRFYQKNTNKWFVLFDSAKILEQLNHIKEKIQELKKSKKQVLLVCEKSLYAEDIKSYASKNGFHYMNYKMPAGFITNFATLKGRIEYMSKQRLFMKSNSYKQITKKEQVVIRRKLSKIEKVYEWVVNLKKEPDYVIVVDGSLMENLVLELKKSGTDNVLMVGSDFNKWRNESLLLTVNLQSYKSVKFVLNYLLG